MANCSCKTDLNCLPPLDDPDITGLLVVLAFVISLIITFGAVLYTYLSLSLPREAYNAFDALIIPDWLVRSSLPSSGQQKDKKRNSTALTSLILTMSDQHLVTGTAMLIASYAIALGAGELEYEKSVYSLRVATSLATLAAIAHISTLFVLRFRFKTRTTDVDVRLVILLAMIVLTFGARLRSSSTSTNEDQKCVAHSSIKDGLLGSSPNVNARLIATIMEMVGLWFCLYRSFKGYIRLGPHDTGIKVKSGRPSDQNLTKRERISTLTTIIFQGGGLRSMVRCCYSGETLTREEEKQVDDYYAGPLEPVVPFRRRLIFALITFYSSSLVEIIWLLLFFIYGLAELFWIYASRQNHDTSRQNHYANQQSHDEHRVVIDPSFGQLMPILILSGSLLGVLSTWIEIHLPQSQGNDLSQNQENGRRSRAIKFRNWIRNIARKRSDENEIQLTKFFGKDQDWFRNIEMSQHPFLLQDKNRRLGWVLFLMGITAMTAVMVVHIIGIVYPDKITVGDNGIVWNWVFIGIVGLYSALHILGSVALGIKDEQAIAQIRAT